MSIALLVALGVDLIVVIAFALVVLGRRRWLKRQAGEFPGAIRATSGDIDGLGPKWKRGSGRWVRDVLVWTKAPLMFDNALIAVDRATTERQAHDGEVKRLGEKPIIVGFAANGASIEIAARVEHLALVTGPLMKPEQAPPATAPV